MKITIAERLHPFSHVFGTKFPLPKSSIAVQVFPTRLQFFDLDHKIAPFNIDLMFAGPVKEFTAELDLELGLIRVFGRTKEGFMRYLLQAAPGGIALTMEKSPSDKVECRHSLSPQPIFLAKQENLHIPLAIQGLTNPPIQERLSLGMHKAQDWESICRRMDFMEIFPIWHRLSAWMTAGVPSKEGNGVLLDACQKKIDDLDKVSVLDAFENFFLAAFEGVLTPQLFDTQYQGILPRVVAKEAISPLFLLTEGGQLIRSLFFQENPREVAILPCLPAQFHCGRMTGIETSQGSVVDFEWTKKSLRRLRLIAPQSGEIRLKLPKGIASCRMRVGRKTIKCPAIDSSGIMIFELNANQTVHLDRFAR